MLDYALGFLCGSITVGLIWMMTTRASKTVYIIQDKSGSYRVDEQVDMPTAKPDNIKARHYNSVDYRNEKHFVEHGELT